MEVLRLFGFYLPFATFVHLFYGFLNFIFKYKQTHTQLFSIFLQSSQLLKVETPSVQEQSFYSPAAAYKWKWDFTFLWKVSSENLVEKQDNIPFFMVLFILIACLLESVSLL